MRKWIIGVAIFILLGLLIINGKSAEPITLVNDKEISSYYINGELIEDKEMVAVLRNTLSEYETKEINNPFPVESRKIHMEINYLSGGKPRHIILGDLNVLYESADSKVFEIINGEDLLVELSKVLNQ